MGTEKERKILEAIDEALPKMSDFDKGYFLGVAESVASVEEKRKQGKEENPCQK